MEKAEGLKFYMPMALEEVYEYGATDAHGPESEAALNEVLKLGFLQKKKEGPFGRWIRKGLAQTYRLTVEGESWLRSNRSSSSSL